ncbi:oligosaccharide flippase family protein [Yoonia sp. R2331]|uniref:oligosaccharide flippase family protein n=1 Tax=Yoonia sp. R2331 TaxID=3237238 RepID=UPI0034E52905
MAYGASEVAAKASRLLVVVAVARTLDLKEIGIAATAIAAGDILKALTENGVGQRIIAAKDRDLAATCATSHRIFWAWCVGLFIVQALIAAGYLWAGGSMTLAVLILLLGAEYLFMPAGLVNVALAMRSGKLKQTASIAGAQVVGANLISIVLVFVWPSAIAMILPRVLSAPIWLIAVRRLQPWSRDRNAGLAPLRPFVQFGWAVLGVELVKALRLQADKMIVGVTMGAEALGLYFMAFNAGLSLSNSFTVAFSTVLFPHLTQTADQIAALRNSLVAGVAAISPIVVLQALLAPIYVPLLLGPDWAGIAHIVSILCLVAIPTTIWTAAAGWLRANNRPDIELWVTIGLAGGIILNTYLLAPMGLTFVATGYAVTATIIFIGASIPAIRPAFLMRSTKA